MAELLDQSGSTLLDQSGDVLLDQVYVAELVPGGGIIDVRVKNDDGSWVSIVGPEGSAADLIDDSRIRDYLTWSSFKIDSELDAHISAHVAQFSPHGTMKWSGAWQSGSYFKNAVVLDGGWLMVAMRDTEERAGIIPVGSPQYGFDGTLASSSVSAKQVIFGLRITPASSGYLTGYRVYAVTGNEYELYSVADPTGTPVISQLAQFTASADGWVEFSINPTLVSTGSNFDLVAVVNEPDPTPTTWTADWEYLKPTNPAVPATGQAVQAGKQLDVLSVHYTDNGATDRTVALQALTVGDIIELDNVSWAIQAITDQTTHIDFAVSPAVQASVSGVNTLTFQTVTATNITYHSDANYWLGNAAAAGLYGADTDYGSIVADDNAYGIDIRFQDAYLPDDWEPLAYTDAANDAEPAHVPVGYSDDATTATITLGDDAGNRVTRVTDSSAVSVTIPQESATNYQLGTVIGIRQAGTGAVSVVTTGLTINGTIPAFAQHSEVWLRKVGSDTWDVI